MGDLGWELLLHWRKIFYICLQHPEGGDNGQEVRCLKIKASYVELVLVRSCLKL